MYTIFWFRRDLRLEDNAGLYRALYKNKNVIPLFIFDKNILEELENKNDRRVGFIYRCIENLKTELNKLGSDIVVKYGEPLEVYKQLTNEYEISSVYTNHDYEPYAQKRDEEIKLFLQEKNIEFYSFTDQVIFEKNEVVKDDGLPYTVYTPYSKKWKLKINSFYRKSYPTEKYFLNFAKLQPTNFFKIEEIGFKTNEEISTQVNINLDTITNYHSTRNIPSIKGTSQLSVHLRFGTVSIRKLVQIAEKTNEKFLNELIWRDFYQQILWHFPHVVSGSFKPQYDEIMWRNNEKEFEAWCNGKTGYPIVDAGMRELNNTGWMHNRVRMIVASFLCKHLLIDWRWGEAYFAKHLNDFDLASNNGGWQWAAGSGVDAAPYFRIFNPRLQTEKFDGKLNYINTWIPELNSFEYPKPIVEHELARNRCLETYKVALKPNL